VMTRYAAVAVLLIPSASICFYFFRHFNLKYFLLTFFCIVLFIIPHLVTRDDMVNITVYGHLEGWSVMNFFHHSFFTTDGSASYAVPNLVYGFFGWFHPGFCFFGIVMFVFFRLKYFKNEILFILFSSVLLYSFFLAGFPYQNLRFLLISFPVIVILFAPLAFSSFSFIPEKLRTVSLVMLTIIQSALFTRAFRPFYDYNRFEKEIAGEVRKFPDPVVYTFGLEGALEAYGVPNRIIGLNSNKLDSVSAGSMVLFNEKQLSRQWQGTNMMINYQVITAGKKMHVLKSYDNGWKLSEAE